jgi:hypothetical protein
MLKFSTDTFYFGTILLFVEQLSIERMKKASGLGTTRLLPLFLGNIGSPQWTLFATFFCTVSGDEDHL